jgi:hypothetical protein
MGVSSHTYLGPYFRCRTRTAQVQAMIATCSNAACEQHGVRYTSSPFCPQCGSMVVSDFHGQRTVTEPHWSDVSEAIDEALQEVTTDDADFGDDYHLWIPNVTRPGQPERDADDRCGVEIAVDGLDIGAERRWLVGAFNAELGILRSMYGGTDHVEIRWGLIKSCS